MNTLLIGLLVGLAVGALIAILAKRGSEARQFLLAECLESQVGAKFSTIAFETLQHVKADLLQLAGAAFDKAKEQWMGQMSNKDKAFEDMVAPVRNALSVMGTQITELEQRRVSAYDGLKQRIDQMMVETTRLSTSMQRPAVRGSWGELTLRTVCENAGMVQGEHFVLQDESSGDSGVLRPDLVVNLPRNRKLVVDAKSPMEAFRDALDAQDEATRSVKFKAHAKHLRDHIRRLSTKQYWTRYGGSPECVILFVPSEAAFFAAIEADPELVTEAAKARVLLANPTTLIGLMRAVAHVLDDERLHQSAQEVKDVGRKLYEALINSFGFISKLGRQLKGTTDAYNDLVKGLDKAVLPRARRLQELGAGCGELPLLTTCEATPTFSPILEEEL